MLSIWLKTSVNCRQITTKESVFIFLSDILCDKEDGLSPKSTPKASSRGEYGPRPSKETITPITN